MRSILQVQELMEEHVPGYIVVTATAHAQDTTGNGLDYEMQIAPFQEVMEILQTKVESHLAAGYQPHGAPTHTVTAPDPPYSITHFASQAMVRPPEALSPGSVRSG